MRYFTELWRKRNREVTGVVLVLLAAALSLLGLTQQSLWYDEGYSLFYSGGATLSESLSRLANSTASERFQPLYFVFLHVWRAVAGSSEYALRLPSAVFVLLSSVLIYLTALSLNDFRRAAASIALGATGAFALYYSHEVRPYGLIMLLSAVQWYLYSRVIRHSIDGGSRWITACFATIVVVSSLTSVFLAFHTFALAVGDLYRDRSIRKWFWRWLPVGVAGLVGTLPHLISRIGIDPSAASVSHRQSSLLLNAVYVPYGLLVGTTYGPPESSLRGSDKLSAVAAYWPSLSVLGVLVVVLGSLVLLRVVRASRSRMPSQQDRDELMPWVVFAATYVLSLCFALLTGLNWVPRHMAFAYGTLLLALPSLLPPAGGGTDRGFPAPALGWGVVLGIIALNLVSIGNYYGRIEYARDDYRAVSRFLKVEARPPARSVLLWGCPGLFDYYGAENVVDGRAFPRDELAEELAAGTRPGDCIYVVINREFYWGPKGAGSLPDLVAAAFSVESTVRYPYFVIYRLVRLSD